MNQKEQAIEVINIQKCFDIMHELQKASILFKCDPKMLCFEIVCVYTFVERQGEGKREISEEERPEFFLKDYEDEGYEISQAYDLKIWKEERKNLFELELSMQDSHLFLVCKARDYQGLVDDLDEVHRQINIKKALLGVIFKEFSMTCNARKLRSELKKAQDGIGGVKKILLEKSKFYSPIVNSTFFFTLEQEWILKNKETHENSSYALKEGQEAGRLIRCRNGNNGRDLLGRFVKIEKREALNMEFGVLDEDFLIEDHEEYSIYRARRNGFAGLNGSGLILIKDFSFEEINHRSIGNLLGGIECGFEVSVKSSSLDKDAIGAGIILEADKINIDGGIDQGAILKARECQIMGLTHQGAKVYADFANIATHKGYLKANEAKIRTCEGGVVECKSGIFEDTVGSEICCKEARVQNLRTNNKISFCTKLEIENIAGGKNDFKIESSAFGEYRDKIDEIQKRYHKYAVFINDALKMYKTETKKIAQMKPAIQRFKDIFLQNVQRGLQTQEYIVETIGEYAKMCEKLNQAKEKIVTYQKRANEIKSELEPISKLCIDAKISCHSAWVDQNQVEYFDLFRNKRESLIIEDGEKVNIVIDSRNGKLSKERR